ncbi:mirror-image polydactyly gene 1 protein isoform X5 [Cetorhinus maximus]
MEDSSHQLIALKNDSDDWTQQEHHDLPRARSFYLEDDECRNSKHDTDTSIPLQISSSFTSVSSAEHCQRINSEKKLDIQSKMEVHNISRAENRGSSTQDDPLTPGQVTKLSDDNRRITFLLKELNAVAESNKKLQNKLTEKEGELEVLKLDTELQEKAIEAKIAEKATVLVEEVYHAQKERDAAVMARLRLANEERDEALVRAKRLEHAIEGLENINPEENDMTLQELLNRINNADTRRAIDKNGDLIVDRIHKTMERKKKITAEEINAVIEERDAALGRCKRLEHELHLLKEQNQTMANNMKQLTTENNVEHSLKAQLLTTQKERDGALQRCKKQDEEIQTLRLYYRLERLVDVLRKKVGTGNIRTVI